MQGAEIVKSERGGEDEQVRPEREELVGAVVRIAGEGESSDSPEEWGGEEDEGNGTSPATGAEVPGAEQGNAGEGRGDGPEEGGLAVGFEEQAEAGEAALGGEGDGPVEVVVQADGGVKGEQSRGESGCSSSEEPELRSDGEVVNAAESSDRGDGEAE